MANLKKRIAFYGGSFDPVHLGHTTIGEKLLEQFSLDAFVYIPAFHAPHKPDRKPTSGYHRYAMLCLATSGDPRLEVSTIELELPEKPYTVETLPRLQAMFPDADIFFVMGADSWEDILTWREWKTVLTMTNHIVVTRPGHTIKFDHVSDAVRGRISDLRDDTSLVEPSDEQRIYISDAVNLNLSATELRRQVRFGESGWHRDVPKEVAKYIQKYEIYK